MKARVCKNCESEWHYKYQCPLLAKPINRIGKAAKATNAAVARWKRAQKPNHQGYYECYMCHRWVEYLEAEHVKSKVRHPGQRADLDNLKPTCSSCNEKKLSKDN